MNPTPSHITVLKFGGSVLASIEDYGRAALEVERWLNAGTRVIAVVSALAGVTDSLLAQAADYGPDVDSYLTAALVATGETHSAARFGLALDRAGLATTVLDPAAIGLLTHGPACNAEAIGLDREAVQRVLSKRPVLVIPGFLGRDRLGRATLLGRGGSDLTALFLAKQMGATECRLVKDVPGLFDRDPARFGPAARRFRRVSYATVLHLDEGIVQHKAVRLAQSGGLAFRVTNLGGGDGTLVSDLPDQFAEGPGDSAAFNRVPEGGSPVVVGNA